MQVVLDAKFTKVMMMTTSSSDGEALSAIRMANRMLERAKMSWDEVLGAPHREPPREPSVSEMLRRCRDLRPGSQFVRSLAEFYHLRGYLTDKQMEALKAIFRQL